MQYGEGPHLSAKITETYKRSDLEFADKSRKKEMRNDSPNLNARNNAFSNTNAFQNGDAFVEKSSGNILDMCKKKQDSDYKRMEAMKKKSQEFKQKKMIVKSGLTNVVRIYSFIATLVNGFFSTFSAFS